MTAEGWVAFAALVFTILSVSGGGLYALFNKADSNKTELLKVITAVRDFSEERASRLEAFCNRELDIFKRDVEAMERRAGEPIFAIREKIAAVELFIRDTFVSKREYERDYAQLLLALKNMQESIEKRLDAYEERVEKAITGRKPRA